MNAHLTLVAAILVMLPATSAPAESGAGNAFEAAFAQVSPAVVRIVNGQRYASGLLVGENGLILTHTGLINKNVLPVYLPDGRHADAKVLLRDKDTELAVLQIIPAEAKSDRDAKDAKEGKTPDAPAEVKPGDKAPKDADAKPAPQKKPAAAAPTDTKWPYVTFDESESKPGLWVATVAYPIGTDAKQASAPSLSTGLLSTRGKLPVKIGTASLPGQEKTSSKSGYEGPLLLTDAMVNAGSEGGALIDSRGRVIGVLCAPQFHKDSGTALNVALPATVVPPLLKRARENPDPPIAEQEFSGRKHGFLGVIKPADAEACRIDVAPGGPAQKAGLKTGDTIVKVGNKAVATFDDLIAILKDTKPGDKLKIAVTRAGAEKPLEFEVELEKYPE